MGAKAAGRQVLSAAGRARSSYHQREGESDTHEVGVHIERRNYVADIVRIDGDPSRDTDPRAVARLGSGAPGLLRREVRAEGY